MSEPSCARHVLRLTSVHVSRRREILELEKKYVAIYAPIYARRKAIIVGDAEPTDAEVDAGEDEDDEEEDDDEEPVPDTTDKGIPEFWLTALKNHQGIAELITERDEKVNLDRQIVNPSLADRQFYITGSCPPH